MLRLRASRAKRAFQSSSIPLIKHTHQQLQQQQQQPKPRHLAPRPDQLPRLTCPTATNAKPASNGDLTTITAIIIAASSTVGHLPLAQQLSHRLQPLAVGEFVPLSADCSTNPLLLLLLPRATRRLRRRHRKKEGQDQEAPRSPEASRPFRPTVAVILPRTVVVQTNGLGGLELGPRPTRPRHPNLSLDDNPSLLSTTTIPLHATGTAVDWMNRLLYFLRTHLRQC